MRGWGLDPFAEDVLGKQIPLAQRPDPANDTGHCLVGPIAVHGAQPGQVLQVDICQLVPAAVGATWVGEVQEFLPQLGVEGYFWLPWQIDVATGLARSSSGHQVPLAPFLGVLGVAPAAPGIHATRPPRAGGGNIDCKDLTVGSTPVFADPGARMRCSRLAMAMLHKVMARWAAPRSSVAWSRRSCA